MSIPKTSISETSISVTSISVSSISVGSIKESRVSLGLSLTLGNMDNSSGVGDITSSTSISTSNSGDGSGSKTSDVGAGRWAVGSISSGIRITSISGISKTVSGIRISSMSIPKTSISVTSISVTSISISSIKKSRVSLSLSFTLSYMDNSGRVGNITASTGISTSNSRDGSGSKTSDVGAGRWADGSISSSIRITSITSMSISKTVSGIRITSISSISSMG